MTEPETKHQFLDLFAYEKTIPPKKSGETSVFENCTFLKPFSEFKVGENVQSIEMIIQLFVWKDDNCIADVRYLP